MGVDVNQTAGTHHAHFVLAYWAIQNWFQVPFIVYAFKVLGHHVLF